MSSDGCGSLPDFDERGNLVKLEMGRPKSILEELRDAVRDEDLALSQAVRVVTSNVADLLKLPGKGRVTVGADADVTLLDDRFEPRYVIARGKVMVRDGEIVERGTFE